MLLGEILCIPHPSELENADGKLFATPMQIKRALDEALLEAGIPFLYACCATDVLKDAGGNVAGIVMANRAGRQAVKAKAVIDASAGAWVAHMAGASFAPYPAGPRQLHRIVIGGKARTGRGIVSRRIPLRSPLGGKSPAQYGSGDWARKQKRGTGNWPGATRAELAWFRPKGVSGLYVLGGCADIPRRAAETLLRPLEFMAMGERIGAAAAAEARARAGLDGVHVAVKAGTAAVAGDTREFLYGLRPTERPIDRIPADARALPVLGEYDVVIVGGGTSGGPAAIGAARRGARTLVIEYLYGLGGVATTGQIGIYCAGYRKGFTATTEKDIEKLGAASYVVGKMESWRREIRKAGGDIWFGVSGVGAFAEGTVVKGVVVATPRGRGVVLARVVIDGTGNSDIAAAAGAECMTVGGEHVAMQGTGLPQRELGARYLNTDWTFVDETDMIDVWSAYVAAKRRYPAAYDLGQLIDTRERRSIVGNHVLTPLDIVNQRTFPDTVGMASGGQLDSHGYTVHPYYTINGWQGGVTYTPYRCLTPKGLDGILVVGLGVSAHRDAIPSIRMQPCMQNLGYAAGVCAAQVAERKVGTRDIDIKAVQRHLVETGCLTRNVPRHKDSFPLSDTAVTMAVRTLATKGYSGLKVLLSRPEAAKTLLREVYAAPDTSPEARLRCAHVLGLMGSATGVPTLVAEIARHERWDLEKIGTSYHPSITWLDSYIIALGQTRDRRGTRPIADKLALLGTGEGGSRFSHYRAAAVALETIGDPDAAPVLAEALKRARLSEATATSVGKDLVRKRSRSGQTQLILARALYRLGDHEGIGETVLRAYEKDLRGLYARHAQAVLRGERKQGYRNE